MDSSISRLDDDTVQAVLTWIDPDLILKLEQGAVRIPSLSFEEHECARYFAREMERLGLEVELMEVEDPYGSGRRGIQPIGWLRGIEGHPSMMLNGHMDHQPVVGEWDRDPYSGDFEDGYVHGRSSQDDKGGIVAAIGAAAAIKSAGLHLRGDVVVCPVMGHKFGGIGTRALINRGIVPDYCINTENSGTGIARVVLGVVKFLLHAHAEPLHFATPVRERLHFMNPFEQLKALMDRLGPSMVPIRQGGWLTFTPNAEVPDYPQLYYDDIYAMYTHPDGLKAMNGATLEAQIRLVPGQSPQTVKADLERLIAAARKGLPNLKVDVEIPPKTGASAGWDTPPFSTPLDAPIIQSLAHWHTVVAGNPPVIGAAPRLGAVGDGNLLANLGVQVVQYGPGSTHEFSQWPTPNERVSLQEIVTVAKAIALTTVELCR